MAPDNGQDGRAGNRPRAKTSGGNRSWASKGHGKGAGKGKPGSASTVAKPQRDPPGFVVRALAVRLISAVTMRGRSLDEALAREFAAEPGRSLEPRDRGLARAIAATVLRRQGELEAVVNAFIERPLPDDRGLLTPILLSAAAQMLVLEIAPHAVLNIAVEQCRRDRGARRFDRLANAVLRRTSERGAALLADAGGARRNIPDWLWSRWVAAYGEATAGRIAEASLTEAALDISLKQTAGGEGGDAEAWAARLGGVLLPTGSIRLSGKLSGRLSGGTRVEELSGFDDGAWWVQDAAAALPVRLLGDVRGLRIADLAAAPGGKTAQLASSGARVTAVDVSAERLQRVRDNLQRLKLEAEVVEADVLTWSPQEPFDAVLLDAPCTATGTIRRHPDILHLKRQGDAAQLGRLQAALIRHAARLVKPGGLLVYCTCSLEPEEGEGVVRQLLADDPALTRVPIAANEVGGDVDWINADGDLRTLPYHLPGTAGAAHLSGAAGAAHLSGAAGAAGGMDGFYACRLRRRG